MDYKSDETGCGCDAACKQTRINTLYGDLLRQGYRMQGHIPLNGIKEEIERHMAQGYDVSVGLTPVLCERLGPVKMRILFLRHPSERPEEPSRTA
jgi:hypothetical protein